MPWEGFVPIKPAVFGLFRLYSDSDFVFIKAQGRDESAPWAKPETPDLGWAQKRRWS